MEHINIAVESVSATSEETTAGSEEISSNISLIVNALEGISNFSKEQMEMAEKLSLKVEKFKVS